MLPQFVLDFFNFIFVLNFTLVSETVIARFVAMLRNPSSTIKACAIFALVQVNDLCISLQDHFLEVDDIH